MTSRYLICEEIENTSRKPAQFCLHVDGYKGERCIRHGRLLNWAGQRYDNMHRDTVRAIIKQECARADAD